MEFGGEPLALRRIAGLVDLRHDESGLLDSYAVALAEAFSAPIGFAWTVGPEATPLLAASCWMTAIIYAKLCWIRAWAAIPLVLVGMATMVRWAHQGSNLGLAD